MTFSSATSSSWSDDDEWSGGADACISPMAALTKRAHIIVNALRDLDFQAIYIAEPSKDSTSKGTTVFAVIEESSDGLYDAMLDAQDVVTTALPLDDIEFRIRESQGRATAEAVPVWTAPIHIR